jgi:hypothetical protein
MTPKRIWTVRMPADDAGSVASSQARGDVREESAAGTGGLGKTLLATIAVVADRRRTEKDRRRVA